MKNQIFAVFKYVVHSAGVSRISISASKNICSELCGCVRWKPSRDYNSSTRATEGFKGLLHMLNATVLPTKVRFSI